MTYVVSILLIVVFLFCASLTWRSGALIALMLMWAHWLTQHGSPFVVFLYWSVFALLWLAAIVSLPRYMPWTSDRVHHVYLNQKGQIVRPPLHHWLLNALLPEEEICNLGIIFSRFLAPIMGIGPGLNENLRYSSKNGTLRRMLRPYWRLERSFENPMSAAYVQGLSQLLKESYKSFYVIHPRNFQKDQAYPLVVFCHGSFGNWKLYQGVLSCLKNCIVLSVGTEDLSGVFLDDEVRAIHDFYIPLLEKMGYRILHDNVTIMGLSKGGTAVREAYAKFSQYFKNIVFLSTWVTETYPIFSHVLIVGGDRDPAARSMIEGYSGIKGNHGTAKMLMIPDATHFVFATHYKQVTEFLNHELGLNHR